MQTSWVVPLKIVEEKCEPPNIGEVKGLERYHVMTDGGYAVGPRLLKGRFPPQIEEWGPFFNKAEAIKLRDRLERHIEEYEKNKRKRGRK